VLALPWVQALPWVLALPWVQALPWGQALAWVQALPWAWVQALQVVVVQLQLLQQLLQLLQLLGLAALAVWRLPFAQLPLLGTGGRRVLPKTKRLSSPMKLGKMGAIQPMNLGGYPAHKS